MSPNCTLPPEGWHCSRAPGHDGPCAARPSMTDAQNSGAVTRTIEREFWNGIPVVAYHWDIFEPEHPIEGLRERHGIAYHWSTGPKDAARLISVDDVEEYLSTSTPAPSDQAGWQGQEAGGANTSTIDLDAEFWRSIKGSAEKSPWIPREHYFMNDWVSDVCRFLREPQGPEWQRIESAPKDGTPILAFGPLPGCNADDHGWKGVRETKWKCYPKGSPGYAAYERGDGPLGIGWDWYESVHNWSHTWTPTHWMPLPTAPTCDVQGHSVTVREWGRENAITAWNTRATPAPSDQAGWQDIASAPRDGTWFLGYWLVATWEDRIQPTSWSSWHGSDDPCFVTNGDSIDWCQPTHWMPLPTAPTLTAGEGGGDE